MQSQLFTSAARPGPDVPRSGAKSKGTGRLRRLAGLVRKESFQILRDPSSFLIAGVLPLLLLFIFGFGVSLDLKRVPIGVVVEWPSPESDSFLASFRNSRYFVVHLRAAPKGLRARIGVGTAQRDRRAGGRLQRPARPRRYGPDPGDR